MQDKILLGFLMNGQFTGYEVKKIMEHSTEFFFTTSAGSIYPAFQKLVAEGLADVRQEVEEGRVKKIYSITEKGRHVFLQWLGDPPSLVKYRDEALLRIFFFSHCPEERRKEEIRSYVDQIESTLNQIRSIEDHVRREADEFQVQTLQFGLDYYGFLKRWYEQFLQTYL
ncbi:MAG: PadR family transcriptional regulator [Spirochaetes bacterium]|nr:PadR family transcriptional regulator [Spirochaetota bacterium]